MSVPGVVLIGTIGAGKTTVAEGISDLLSRVGTRHALIDLDWLGQVYPPPDPGDPFDLSLSIRNLRAIWPNLRTAGAERLVLAATLTNEDELQMLRDALPEVEWRVVRIVASPAAVAERISAREKGGLLEDFLARTDELAAEIASAELEESTVSNRSPQDAAAEVISLLGWLNLGT
jgi:hypothetical protein